MRPSPAFPFGPTCDDSRMVGYSYLIGKVRFARHPCTIAKVSPNLVTIELFSDRFYNMLVDVFVRRLVF